MDPLEKQLRLSSRSFTAYAGAVAMSALLFAAMASISVVVHPTKPPPERPLSYAFVPPPPPPVDLKEKPAMAAALKEAFKFDPTTIGAAPEVSLELLDITFEPVVATGLAIEMDLQRTFSLQKPEPPDQMVIFERDQVDEIPVWLYGPQPRIPRRFEDTDWYVNVLYVVTDRGVTEKIFVLDSSSPELIQPVKAAISQWRFRPGRKGGRAVRVWVQQPVKYEPDVRSPFTL